MCEGLELKKARIAASLLNSEWMTIKEVRQSGRR